MRKEIEIQAPTGLQVIRQDKLFVIAEVGNQFNGNVDTAKELARVAKEAGADAVKYIFWFPDEILADNPQYTYKTADGAKTEPMFTLLDRLRLSPEEWVDVMFYCSEIGITMMATITCPSAFTLAIDLGLPILKLSTWDWNFPDLWDWCASAMLPCIADMGAVNEDEIARNLKIFVAVKNKDLILMHCFHTQNYNEMNMLSIPYIKEKFDCLAGHASTDYNDETDIMAVALGACVLEKRLTLDRRGGVLHDALSKEPYEFKEYVEQMRNLKKALGKEAVIPSNADLAMRKKYFRRVVADCGISKGEIITRNMLEAKRGETGITSERIWEFVGKQATRDIKRNEDIRPEDTP